MWATVISSGRVDQLGENAPERFAWRPVMTLARVGVQLGAPA
jgi:hypothetical protein